MPHTNVLFNNFSGGEIGGKTLARSDIPLFKSVVEWSENFIVLPQGPLSFRQGTNYVWHTRLHNFAVFIPFQFNDSQSYLIEATDRHFRFYKESGIITLGPQGISGITNSNPAVVHSPAHGATDGKEVIITGVQGMTEINGQGYIVSVIDPDHYQISDIYGNSFDTTSFGVYTGGGAGQVIYEINTQYLEVHLRELQYAQNADTMYIAHRRYDPFKLTRITETNWDLTSYSRLNDPFSGPTNNPGSVTFTDDGRLVFAGTDDHPETIWASRAPLSSNGFSRYDDFSTGSLATDGWSFTLAPLQGKVDNIKWISNTNKFLVVGTFGGVRHLYGAAEDQPVTPTAINAKPAANYGATLNLPVSHGTSFFYLASGASTVRALEYDWYISGYWAIDKNLVSEQIVENGLLKLVNQKGKPDILWVLRADGHLAGMTYDAKENKFAWHQHKCGKFPSPSIQTIVGIADTTDAIDVGLAEVIHDEIVGYDDIGAMPRTAKQDMLWVIVKRYVNGKLVRHVEAISDSPIYPQALHFYTGKQNRDADTRRYLDRLFETQKAAVHLDAAVQYDGNALPLSLSAHLTVDAGALTVGTVDVIFQSNVDIFTAAMVGKQLWGTYRHPDGFGGGRVRVDNYDNPRQIRGTILSAFRDRNVIYPQDWAITTDHVSGIWHLEAGTVSVMNDGSVHPPLTVHNGQVTLTKQASQITIGLGYTGLVKTVHLDQGGLSGPAVSKYKNCKRLHIQFQNSAGPSVGTNPYDVHKIDFRSTADITGRPTPLFTGIKVHPYTDGTEREKHVYLVQDEPKPCTILSIEPYVDTTDEGQ